MPRPAARTRSRTPGPKNRMTASRPTVLSDGTATVPETTAGTATTTASGEIGAVVADAATETTGKPPRAATQVATRAGVGAAAATTTADTHGVTGAATATSTGAAVGEAANARAPARHTGTTDPETSAVAATATTVPITAMNATVEAELRREMLPLS
jgi:hypothetical protein